MPAPARAFLSYNYESDRELAARLVDRLDAGGVTVWWSERDSQVGDDIEPGIREALRLVHHGIFLVSSASLDSEYCRFEVEQFALLHPDRTRARRIVVLREPDLEARLPRQFVGLQRVEWLRDEADEDSRVWRIYCALTGNDRGAPRTWSAAGRRQCPASTSSSEDGGDRLLR